MEGHAPSKENAESLDSPASNLHKKEFGRRPILQTPEGFFGGPNGCLLKNPRNLWREAPSEPFLEQNWNSKETTETLDESLFRGQGLGVRGPGRFGASQGGGGLVGGGDLGPRGGRWRAPGPSGKQAGGGGWRAPGPEGATTLRNSTSGIDFESPCVNDSVSVSTFVSVSVSPRPFSLLRWTG